MKEKLYRIKNRFSGKTIFSYKCRSFPLCVEIAVALGVNLSRADLFGADLFGANFSGANFSGANFSGANLSLADFSLANFYGANFYGANFYGANLSLADFSRANFSGANLSRADLSGANFSGANLSRADLSGADLDFSCLPLRCGSLTAKTDEKQRKQIAYHLASLFKHAESITDEEKAILNSLRDYANGFHRVGEVELI